MNYNEEFSCDRCHVIVKDEGDLCPACKVDEEEAAKDRRFDEAVALGYGV